ncbi:MarR family winged helix-turn-helix transcriptional regulator [Nocardioides sp. NPDC059952]|uniref:MarR family winged helix-turn-helix transcriptional regulator n=1 Tax=Nocardioides sp. NPDC059952 TaxID=3347014 RepID=UPI003665DC70
MHRSRTANLLGAAAQGLNDHIRAGLSEAARLSDSASATLILLSDSGGIGASELGRRLGLTQSAAVRMVEGLERDGLLQRGPKAGRNVAITLTARGRDLAQDLREARGRSLDAIVNTLAPEELEQLEDLLMKLLPRLHHQPGDADRLCRLCDRQACIEGDVICPVGQAERDCRADSRG